jgi:hypothetical protein
MAKGGPKTVCRHRKFGSLRGQSKLFMQKKFKVGGARTVPNLTPLSRSWTSLSEAISPTLRQRSPVPQGSLADGDCQSCFVSPYTRRSRRERGKARSSLEDRLEPPWWRNPATPDGDQEPENERYQAGRKISLKNGPVMTGVRSTRSAFCRVARSAEVRRNPHGARLIHISRRRIGA